MEIERKWLVKRKDIPYELEKLESYEISQSYISFSPTIRARKQKTIDKCEYILTIKGKGKIAREEYELFMTEKEYLNVIKKAEGRTICKTRYLNRRKDGLVEEIDVFKGEFEGLVYLEIEFPSIDEANNFVAPTWCLSEVSSTKGFSNASLAKNGMPKIV